ncbi:MAG: glycosyltransferase family 4 protein [Candidatus Acidiferrales bacterium]
MHVLLLNEYYPPDTSATAKMAAMVAEAIAQRHDVTVVAGRPSYDPEEHYRFAWVRKTIRNGVTVECVGSTDFPRHKMKRRVANYLSYMALGVPHALGMRTDLVLAMTDPPVAGIAGALVAGLQNRPFVYNIRDMYPDMALGGDIVNASPWLTRWENMHRWALRSAARVVVLGEDMRTRIIAKGVDPARVVVVRDGTGAAGLTPQPGDPITQEIRCGFKFTMVHAGNLGFYGAWSTLVKAAELLRDESTGLVFVGDGANRARIEESAKGLDNVRFLPFRPFSQVPNVMAAGDLQVITVKPGLEGVVVPSKMYSILAAGRPVLVVSTAETDAAQIVRESGCGLTAHPDDPQGVADAVRSVRNDPARLEQMGHRAREWSARYDKVKELARFVEVIEDAAKSKSGNGDDGSLNRIPSSSTSEVRSAGSNL